MMFSYRKVDSLPRLAWCALLTQGDRVVLVYHGKDVEIDPEGFFEGAWNGLYQAKAFDEASLFCGSGARLKPGKVIFSTDTAIFDWLYSVRVYQQLFISNSMTFLFSITGDQPDPGYPFYYYDLINYSRLGLREKNRVLHTERNRKIRLHWVCNLEVDASLGLLETPKFAGDPPASYEDYIGQLTSAFKQLADNAADPARKLQYSPLCALSTGYDTNACAALVSRFGYRDAYTFQQTDEEVLRRNEPDDSGLEIGLKLGLNVTCVSTNAYRHLIVPRDDEFCANPAGSEVRLAGLEQELEGRLLAGGRMGDLMWGTDPRRVEPDYMRPGSTHISGLSANDFRLRVGYLRIDLPQLGWQHPQAVHNISASGEMRPWRIGGQYDRPIPRRILEESLVPRDLFGKKKLAGGFVPLPFDLSYLSEGAAADYNRFFAEIARFTPLSPIQRVGSALPVLARQILSAFRMSRPVGVAYAFWATLIVGRRALSAPVIKGLYTFHWGVERLKSRYEIPDKEQ